MAMRTPKFVNINQSNFHAVLKNRVNEYFAERKKSITGNFGLHFKAVLFWSLYIAGYVWLVFYTPHNWIALLSCVLMGGLTAAIGFNVMHDGGHGSFSKSEWINKAAAYSVNLLGASMLMWKTKHNVVHHTYTNIEGWDDDLEAGYLMRLSPEQEHWKMHKYQHFYFWFLYTLLLLSWVLFGDFKKYFSKKIGTYELRKFKTLEHLGFWGAKIIYFSLMFALPIYKLGFLNWLIGFLIIAMVAGFLLSIVFQLAHTVEETSFPVPNESTDKIENAWAIHQLQTTANFATRNKLISWLVGGLNFQIEHHLFPKISHVHYPAISKIIKKTCMEYNIPYLEHRHMRQAIVSHALHLKKLGRA